ncbi:sigma-70 family RNA polymerase sigma factor [Pseudonocardia sp. DSM 110487]|uniref:RNA polymerase sigma factor n=1 Tax=Pseudonocardia sp. DSM 110487 TaxID=2865833 RepID=UPI001C69A7E1|nr:sigma-70 family RNA polymerase sigma factor [Pseudonocardia sp. DSM 110487]QYN37083.1 sigma-70 family RNA polymerase sigma factor [Pseudonocardia sp. DSM 110487]
MIDEIFRAEWGRVVASLVGFCRDVDVAEDAAQEAFALAAQRWARDGPPDEPRAWLVTVGRNKAIDRLRRDRRHAEKLQLMAPPPETPMPATAIPDERLELIFLCCHPALAAEARVALTLRALGGLSTAEIARAFLVPEETMKRRLTRARTKVKAAGIPFAVPGEELLPARLGTVLAVLYLIFNQGYGDQRVDLAAEAIRMGRMLVELLRGEPEPRALLALMLLHDARRDARTRDGELVLLPDQDRSRWNAAQIAEGRALLPGTGGPYALQAAIAALQTEDPIDWQAVAERYAALGELTGSAVVELNRAVAVAETSGPRAALTVVEAIAADLDGYRYLHSTRAELLRRLGDLPAARTAYRRALDLTTTGVERRFLERRLAEM